MIENRVIPPHELIDMICSTRAIANKNKQGFSDPVVKKRHDDMDFNREVERINKVYL